MKKVLLLGIVLGTLFLGGCENTEIGIIGGADGPTEIITMKMTNRLMQIK